jgi:hypothetical protein
MNVAVESIKDVVGAPKISGYWYFDGVVPIFAEGVLIFASGTEKALAQKCNEDEGCSGFTRTGQLVPNYINIDPEGECMAYISRIHSAWRLYDYNYILAESIIKAANFIPERLIHKLGDHQELVKRLFLFGGFSDGMYIKADCEENENFLFNCLSK